MVSIQDSQFLNKFSNKINFYCFFLGLYTAKVNAQTGAFNFNWVTFFNAATDFYYNSVRSYVQLGGWDEQLLELYGQAIDSALKVNIFTVYGGRMYFRDYNAKTQWLSSNMESNGCLLGGMFALSSLAIRQKRQNSNVTTEDPRAQEHLKLAVNITETCYQVANNTLTKLLPDKFSINSQILDKETTIL